MKQNIIKNLKILSLALVIGLGVSYASAWTGPTATPPLNNVPPPINTGGISQIKSAGLTLNQLSVTGPTLLWSTAKVNSGNDASAPPLAVKLHVNGDVGAERYCNEFGTDCFTADEVGGSSTSTNSGTPGHFGANGVIAQNIGSGTRNADSPYVSVACPRSCSIMTSAHVLIDTDEDSGGGASILIYRRYRSTIGSGSWSAPTNISVLSGSHHGGDDGNNNFGHDVPLSISHASNNLPAGEYQFLGRAALNSKWDSRGGKISIMGAY